MRRKQRWVDPDLSAYEARLAFEEEGGPYAPNPSRQITGETAVPLSHNDTEWRSKREHFNRNVSAKVPRSPAGRAANREPSVAWELPDAAIDANNIPHGPDERVYIVELPTWVEVRAFIPEGLRAIHGTGRIGHFYVVVDATIELRTRYPASDP